MFAKNKVSQSMIDAVNKIMSEKEEETKEQFLSEGWDEMLKSVKDKNKPQPSGGAGKKQGSRYGGSKQKEEPAEKEVKEELKGNQHKIDANHNNKIDGQDFKILRGKKKVKEDTFAAKLLNSLSESEEIQKAINEVMKKDATAGDWIHDFVHSDNPRFDGKSTKERQKMALGAYYAKQNEEVEDLAEKEGTGGSDPLANRQDYAKRHGTGQVYKKTHAGDKTGMTQAFAYDIKRSGPKGKLPEEVEQVAEASTYKLGRADAETKEFPIKQNGEHVGRLEFHVSAGKLHHRAGNAKDVSYDKWHGNPNTESLVNAHVAKHEAEARKHFAKKLKEEVELNEVSKSEVDHHYDKWTSSSDAPNHHDAGDDNKIHKSALKYLRGTNVPKENHEKLAMHIANKFHGSGIDEAAPKKMDDVAKQNLTPAKKGVVGTVKSDFKNFKNFLAGKKETNEAVDSNKQTIDTLAGRSKKVPKEAKIDNDHSSAKVELKSEEVEQLDEDRWLMKYLLSRGINPQFVSRNQKVAHAKSNEFKKYRRDHQQMQGEEVQSEATSPIFRPKPTDYNSAVKQRTRRNTGLPFAGPYTKVSADPMQRARSMAQSAMQSVKDKQNQPTTMDKVKSAVDKTKRVATKTFMTAFKP